MSGSMKQVLAFLFEIAEKSTGDFMLDFLLKEGYVEITDKGREVLKDYEKETEKTEEGSPEA